MELARILARIGYVCEGNVPINLSFMDSIFSMTYSEIFLLYTGKRKRKSAARQISTPFKVQHETAGSELLRPNTAQSGKFGY